MLRMVLGVIGAAMLPAPSIAATAAPHVSPDDPAAKALGYVNDASKIDGKNEHTYKAGSTCANCALFQAAQANGGYGPCSIFPGKVVNASGWCRAYSAKS